MNEHTHGGEGWLKFTRLAYDFHFFIPRSPRLLSLVSQSVFNGHLKLWCHWLPTKPSPCLSPYKVSLALASSSTLEFNIPFFLPRCPCFNVGACFLSKSFYRSNIHWSLSKDAFPACLTVVLCLPLAQWWHFQPSWWALHWRCDYFFVQAILLEKNGSRRNWEATFSIEAITLVFKKMTLFVQVVMELETTPDQIRK